MNFTSFLLFMLPPVALIRTSWKTGRKEEWSIYLANLLPLLLRNTNNRHHNTRMLCRCSWEWYDHRGGWLVGVGRLGRGVEVGEGGGTIHLRELMPRVSHRAGSALFPPATGPGDKGVKDWASESQIKSIWRALDPQQTGFPWREKRALAFLAEYNVWGWSPWQMALFQNRGLSLRQ